MSLNNLEDGTGEYSDYGRTGPDLLRSCVLPFVTLLLLAILGLALAGVIIFHLSTVGVIVILHSLFV